MVSITDLEMAGCELDNSGVTAPDVCPSPPIIPVSYTHLDVYKRQCEDKVCCAR